MSVGAGSSIKSQAIVYFICVRFPRALSWPDTCNPEKMQAQWEGMQLQTGPGSESKILIGTRIIPACRRGSAEQLCLSTDRLQPLQWCLWVCGIYCWEYLNLISVRTLTSRFFLTIYSNPSLRLGAQRRGTCDAPNFALKVTYWMLMRDKATGGRQMELISASTQHGGRAYVGWMFNMCGTCN